MPNRGANFSAYRYGYQNQECDPEISGERNSYAFEYRFHDPRLGRFLSIDPLAGKYPYWSPYAFSGNRVIDMIELEGLEPIKPLRISNNPKYGKANGYGEQSFFKLVKAEDGNWNLLYGGTYNSIIWLETGWIQDYEKEYPLSPGVDMKWINYEGETYLISDEQASRPLTPADLDPKFTWDKLWGAVANLYALVDMFNAVSMAAHAGYALRAGLNYVARKSVPLVTYLGKKVPVYRGGNSFKLKPGEYKVDKKTGLVKTTHGVSLDVDTNNKNIVGNGGAYQIEELPEGLNIIQRGDKAHHFEIVPSREMSVEQFQELLDQIKVKPK